MRTNTLESARLAKALISWYQNNRRDLPWREDPVPYKVWLSEIILQQTRVEQGLPYFYRFIAQFPDVNALAAATEDEVLKLWQGLGYYSRARNLHKTAKIISEAYNGVFPSKYEQLIQLAGVGPYTAAAIASIAFNEAKAVVDGNVIRVISRIFGISDPVDEKITLQKIQGIASELISNQNPSEFNQAMMEFGALQCIPNNPNCEQCVLKSICIAHAHHLVNNLPYKSKKIKRKSRYLHFAIITDGHGVLLEKREQKDIWEGLYQFPLLEKHDPNPLEIAELLTYLNCEGTLININEVKKHVLTHQDIYACFYHFESDKITSSKFPMVSLSDLHTFALPRLIDRYLENYVIESGKKRH
jgi:A/G-specific adenine glycosylase